MFAVLMGATSSDGLARLLFKSVTRLSLVLISVKVQRKQSSKEQSDELHPNH